MNKAVRYPIDYVIEMYPDCPSHVEFLPFYFFCGVWVRMEGAAVPTEQR